MNNVDLLNAALNKLFPGLWATHGATVDSITWGDGHNTTAGETTKLEAEVARLQAEYTAQEYARKRASEYPPITDYLDGVVKGDQAQIDKYIADCQAVKAKYPKPVE